MYSPTYVYLFKQNISMPTAGTTLSGVQWMETLQEQLSREVIESDGVLVEYWL